MDPDIPSFMIADVVMSTAGRDTGRLYYVIAAEETYLSLVNGKDRSMDKPKRKKQKHTKMVLRSDTRVAQKLRDGEKVLSSEIRKDLAYLSRTMQENDLGG